MSSNKKKGKDQEPQDIPETAAAPAAPETEAEAPAKNQELEKAKADFSAEHDKYLRILAEYDNFRKRSAKERESIYTDVRAETIIKFLPVYDNLCRALAQSTEDAAYRKGVEMIMTQFDAVLEKLSVKPIEAVGQKFDPTLHNAVMHIEDEAYGEGVVAEEFEKGFMLGDKVIRFSMVKVAN